MDFISEYFYVIILIVGAIAQWLKSRSESKQGGGNERGEHGYDTEELEDFESQAERMNPRPSAPPPLPPSGGALPGLGRSPVPDLQRKSSSAPGAMAWDATDELGRHQALIEKAQEFKRARKSKEPIAPALKTNRADAAMGISGRLHNRAELRSAFVLKEILEKPVGLR